MDPLHSLSQLGAGSGDRDGAAVHRCRSVGRACEVASDQGGRGAFSGGVVWGWICSDTGGVRTASTGVNCLIADQGIVYHTRSDAV